MSLEICPTCGVQDSIFLTYAPAVGLDGKLYGGRREAFCNNTRCDQRYWYIPRSGRITRRNTGITYQEWRLRRIDVDLINVMRRSEGMAKLIEEPVTIVSVGSNVSSATVKEFRDTFDASVADPPPAPILGTVEKGLGPIGLPDLRGLLFEKWCMVRAFFVVFVPGFRRFSVCPKENDNAQ